MEWQEDSDRKQSTFVDVFYNGLALRSEWNVDGIGWQTEFKLSKLHPCGAHSSFESRMHAATSTGQFPIELDKCKI